MQSKTYFYERTLQTGYKSCTSITAEVAELIEKSGVREGFAVISFPHSTIGMAVTSFWDERGLSDMMDEFDRNVPPRVTYKHQDSPFDTAAHVKNVLMRGNLMLMIYKGKMVLGSSQGLVYVDFDGPRKRKYCVQIVTANMAYKILKLHTAYAGMHDVTNEVLQAVAESGVQNGICHIAMLHSTAGMLITSKNETAQQDIMNDIERMMPTRADFKHRETAADAGGHVKTALAGSQLTLAVNDGKLLIGEDQALVFAEFDGPRPRSFTVGVYEG